MPLKRRMNRAYIAGIIDGEGCIRFQPLRYGIVPVVLVVNTNLALLQALQTELTGNIYSVVHRRPEWKPAYEWRLQWTRAVNLLAEVNPWLRIKHLQAQTVFAWDAMRPGRGRWGRRAMDPEVKQLFLDRMRWLNRKGRDDGSPDPIDVVLAECGEETGQCRLNLAPSND